MKPPGAPRNSKRFVAAGTKSSVDGRDQRDYCRRQPGRYVPGHPRARDINVSSLGRRISPHPHINRPVVNFVRLNGGPGVDFVRPVFRGPSHGPVLWR